MAELTARQKFMQLALKYGLSIFGIPKTGQTITYSVWDDGYYKNGAPRIGNRFTDNGDGTITDNATGLMWVKDPSQLGGVWGTPGNPSVVDWEGALIRCKTLNYAGHEDWRLPNMKELQSIVDYSVISPMIDVGFFPYTQSARYWTGTTNFPVDASAWYVDFQNGIDDIDDKLFERYVRPVRGIGGGKYEPEIIYITVSGLAKTGQIIKYKDGDDGDYQAGLPKTGARFTDNGDGTITDNVTGLMWVKDPSELGGVWGTPGSPSWMTWDQCIENCEALNYAGHNDWRLPNAKELKSIYDLGKYNPAIDTDYFKVWSVTFYASSTTYKYDTDRIWVVSTDTGSDATTLKSGSMRARPVRGGL